ncbi:MAG: hypothetical protein ACJ79H_10250 [Myxococcales bacterium]
MSAPNRGWLVPVVAASLLFACRTAQPRGSGALVVTPLYNPAARPVYLGVDGPHLFAHGGDADVDFEMEELQDGCARGAVNGNPVEVCPVPGQPGESGPVKTFRLNGPLGARTFTVEQRGDRVYVDFGINQGRGEFVVPDGLLRQHPEMAALAWFFGAFGRPRPGSERQAYVIRQRD